MKQRHKKIAQAQARTLTRMLKLGGKDRMKFPKQLLGGHRVLYTRKERSEVYARNGENYRDSYGFSTLLKNTPILKKASIMRALHPTLVKHEMLENYHFRKNHGRLHRVYGGYYEIKLSLVEILYGLPGFEKIKKEGTERIKTRVKSWCEKHDVSVPVDIEELDRIDQLVKSI